MCSQVNAIKRYTCFEKVQSFWLKGKKCFSYLCHTSVGQLTQHINTNNDSFICTKPENWWDYSSEPFCTGQHEKENLKLREKHDTDHASEINWGEVLYEKKVMVLAEFYLLQNVNNCLWEESWHKRCELTWNPYKSCQAWCRIEPH